MARGKYAEMVEDEVARAEAEPDDDGEPEPEPDDDEAADDDEATDEPVDEPEAEAVPLSAEAFAERLETVIQLHADNLAGLFGEAYGEMEACPLCQGLGATPPDGVRIDPETEKCPECGGHGGFQTESHVPNNLFRQCARCSGNGYVTKAPPIPQYVPPERVNAPNGPTSSFTIQPMPQLDPTTGQWRTPDGQLLVAVP